MVNLSNKEKEIGVLKDIVATFDLNNKKKEFSVQIARNNWRPELAFGSYIYVPGSEFGGEVGEMLTNTTLDYVELKGFTWRGRLDTKIIEPPDGNDYKTVSGELHTVMKELIEPEFEGLFLVAENDTEISVDGFQFDRYCTLLSGLTKMLKSAGCKLRLTHKRVKDASNYVLVEAVPIVDYSSVIELSKDCRLNYSMTDKKNGVNHLIVTGKGELQERNILHLYMWPDGVIRTEQYYTGKDEISMVYENTSTETEELRSQAEEKFKEVCSKKTFKMDVEKLGLNVGIGDIVGGRDYLTGLYAAKPIENITYAITNGVVEKIYKLEGEDSK